MVLAGQLSSDKEKLVSMRDLSKGLGVTRVTVWRWISEKGFPPGLQVSPGRKAWVAGDVNEWLQKQSESG